MSRSLFENSKAALAFAALTIFGAVSMVGTSDNDGVLSAVVERFGTMPEAQASAEQPSSEAPSKDAKPAGAGWGSSPTSVFGDFSGKPTEGEESGGSESQGGNPMTAPISPTATVNNSTPSGFLASGSEEPIPAE